MINIDQVKALESKVRQALQLIHNLKNENQYLKTRLSDYELRIRELENLVSGFKSSQNEIETSLLHVLQELEQVEDSSTESMFVPNQDNLSIGSESQKEEEQIILESQENHIEEVVQLPPAETTLSEEPVNTSDANLPDIAHEIEYQEESSSENNESNQDEISISDGSPSHDDSNPTDEDSQNELGLY